MAYHGEVTEAQLLPLFDPPLSISYEQSRETSVRRTISLGAGRRHESRTFIDGDLVGDSWDRWWQSFLRGATTQYLGGRTRPLNVVDLFSSAGGLSLGVREASRALGYRFEAQLAADLDEHALATFRANFAPLKTVNASVRSLVDYQIESLHGRARFVDDPVLTFEASDLRDIDLVVGGPPCQGHSSLNNHTRGNDFRNDLYLTLPAVTIAANARAVIIENVPRVIHDSGEVVASSVQLLENAGYHVASGVLAADALGWPQTRARHFLIASREAAPMFFGDVVQALHRQAASIFWAIGGLEDAVHDDDILHSIPMMSAENIERVAWLFEREKYDLENQMRPECHRDGHTYPAVYGRLHPDRPAPTITSGFQTPGRGRFIHPTRRRVLTAREAARIQGFPDSFQFVGANGALTKSMLQKWIGDAVPSILGFNAGLIALETLK